VAKSRSAPAGFTLIEVIVALAISGIVILGARAVLIQLADGTDRVVQAAADADREANAERVLRALVGRTEAGSDSIPGFLGTEQIARFPTWCDVAAGWQERCHVTLAIVPLAGAQALVVHFTDGEILPLRRGLQSGALRYLNDAGGGGVWLRSWENTITTPLALGLILDEDTLIVRIGERG
jgi:prepilin-type N-terminal cleavage/methylation domain-containing protein